MTGRDPIARLRRAPAWAIDLALTAAVALPTVMDAWWNEPGSRQADTLTYALTVAMVAGLPVRRRFPFPVALASGAALSGLYLLGHHGELLNLPVMLALYTIAVQGDRRTTIVTAVVASGWSGLLGFTSDDPIGARGGSPVLEMLVPLVPLALGEAARLRRELLAQAAAEREREARRRIEAERGRMAREVHDVVAHTMVAVNVQVNAAVAALDTEPEIARQALLQARSSSKAALRELRASVAVLRDGDGATPPPSLARLDDLAAPARAAGLEVSIHDDRHGTRLSGAVELTAYRVVQEALTNVLRHSQAHHVTVDLRADGGQLAVTVVDDGPGATRGGDPGRDDPGPGYGLAGMGERVHATGGRLEHGPTATGGFRVHAVLPTAAHPVEEGP